jgi:hypothetical protein
MPKPKGRKRNRGLNQGRQKQEWTVPYEDPPAAQKAKMKALARMQRSADVRCGLAEVEHMRFNMALAGVALCRSARRRAVVLWLALWPLSKGGCPFL